MGETTQENRLLKITTPLGADFLLLHSMKAQEEISKIFSIEVVLLHEEEASEREYTAVKPEDILGQSVTIALTQEDGGSRFFNGIVNSFAQGEHHTRFSHYYATIVPQIWILTQIKQSRIFQHLSVPDILRKVFAGYEVSYEMQGEFKPRNYCVQYRESDFDFAARLMEEEGLYFYFEHQEETHKMIIGNTPQSHLDCPNKKILSYVYDIPEDFEWESTVFRWNQKNRLQSGKFTFWDFNFQVQKQKLEAEQPTQFTVAGNSEMEIYDYPAGYARKYDGIDKSGGERAADLQNLYQDNAKTAKNRMQMLDAMYSVLDGGSDCCTLTAGHRFELKNHPKREHNGKYTITSTTHYAEQTPPYVTDSVSAPYRVDFTSILHTTVFRPPLTIKKPIVHGSQTAFVVGPAGEEIFTDKYGRVKVQMHWDREGEINENSSCWIRVAQAWAGNRWGMMFIPRIGMEVIVHFLEGDPDQPIITGCVYNAGAMPPYPLPDEKTKMTIKSDSSKGGQGFNELRFEDKKGEEQIFIHGQKDLDVRVKADRREWTGNDQHLVVKNDRREKIENDSHLSIGRNQIEEIKGNRHQHVSGEEAVKIDGGLSLKVDGGYSEQIGTNLSSEATANYYIKGMNVVIEAMAGLTLKVGGNFITINPAGVQINGLPVVMINSGGSALAGSAGAITPPQTPAVADDADDAKPGTIITLQKRSAARKENRHKDGADGGANDKNQKKKSWIKIKLIDEAGNPVPGKRFKVTTPDGRIASGSTNKEGKGEIKGIEPGSCKITFPDLDSEAWEEA